RRAAGTEEWRRNADMQRMSPEEVQAAGVEVADVDVGHDSGPWEVLHQRGGRLPLGAGTMPLMGFNIIVVIGYLVMYHYQKVRPGTTYSHGGCQRRCLARRPCHRPPGRLTEIFPQGPCYQVP
uniref:Uncharacterized protein n=1 Tax=Aegilops tauschii subsp. strangulata TaxID=200361 RepID=A0A453S2B5_AEGTS